MNLYGILKDVALQSKHSITFNSIVRDKKLLMNVKWFAK